MGKVFRINKQATDPIEPRFCKNCGTLIPRQSKTEGFCCKGCKEEYDIKYQPQHKKILDTTALPYKAYTT